MIGQNVDIYRWHLNIKTQKYRYGTHLKNDSDPALVSLHASFITSVLFPAVFNIVIIVLMLCFLWLRK